MHPRAGSTWRDCPSQWLQLPLAGVACPSPTKRLLGATGASLVKGASVTPDSHSQARESTPANRGIWAATTCTPVGTMCSEDIVAVRPVPGEGTALWVRKEQGPRPVTTEGCEHRDRCHHYFPCACGERLSVCRNTVRASGVVRAVSFHSVAEC